MTYSPAYLQRCEFHGDVCRTEQPRPVEQGNYIRKYFCPLCSIESTWRTTMTELEFVREEGTYQMECLKCAARFTRYWNTPDIHHEVPFHHCGTSVNLIDDAAPNNALHAWAKLGSQWHCDHCDETVLMVTNLSTPLPCPRCLWSDGMRQLQGGEEYFVKDQVTPAVTPAGDNWETSELVGSDIWGAPRATDPDEIEMTLTFSIDRKGLQRAREETGEPDADRIIRNTIRNALEYEGLITRMTLQPNAICGECSEVIHGSGFHMGCL